MHSICTRTRLNGNRQICAQVNTHHGSSVEVAWQQRGFTMEEEDDSKQTLFKRKPRQRNRDGCRMCRSQYRKWINTCLTWEMVLMVMNVLLFLILIFKWVKDGRLHRENRKLFRSYESGGHFMQGVILVLLIVPFKFNKRVIKWIYNFAMKNEIYMDECIQQPYQHSYGDIEDNKMGNYLSSEEYDHRGVGEKGNERNSGVNTALGSFDDNNIDRREVGDGAANNQTANNQTVNNQTVNSQRVNSQRVNNQTGVEHSADASEMDTGKRDGHAEFIRIGYTNSGSGGNDIDHQNGNAGRNSSGERLTMNRRKKGSNSSSDSPHREHTNRKVPVCESFINSLVFPVNTPKHTREKIQYFFLCSKLYANKKISFLFAIKYACSFILMFSYPLYNLVKRKVLHNYFYHTSYYINAFDFAAGVFMGSLFVLFYGVVKFFANLRMNRKNEKFYFFDNYPFMREVTCLCDENVWINIHNNPNLKGVAIQYLNSYRTYKSFLLKGILFLFFMCICAFAFTLTTINAPSPDCGTTHGSVTVKC